MPITPDGVTAMKTWFQKIDVALISIKPPILLNADHLDEEALAFTISTYTSRGWKVNLRYDNLLEFCHP
jgi:hypothetical protein